MSHQTAAHRMTSHITPILAGVAQDLDIDPARQERVVALYEDLGDWLAQQQPGLAKVEIYSQGSFRLGTVVRPSGQGGQFDIDLVFLRGISKASITKAELREQAGDLLVRYCRERGYPAPIELGRCWRLEFFEDDFHLDVLPVIPDDERRSETSILLSDKDEHHWLTSNPIGYSNWFYDRMNDIRIEESRTALAKQLDRSVEEVPVFLVRTPLQRAVQVLKRHRDLYFSNRAGDGPPSVLITTLAAHAYDGQADVTDAVLDIVDGIPNHIAYRDGQWLVPNPSHPDENFADKWNTQPDRKDEFDDWLARASADFTRAVDTPGIETAGNHLAKSLGGESLDVSNRILGIAPPKDFAAAAHGGPLAPHEQSIEDRFPVRLDHQATVVCEILPDTGWNRTSRRALKRRRHKKHEHLEFQVTDTTLPEPYEVYWKVRNYGRDAWLRGQLRGQIKHGQRTHRESTLYRGEHYVDCYLVKDGVCRARTRVWVPIT